MASFLLECFSEEIPSRMQRGACEQLTRLFTAQLEKAGIAHGAIRTFVSPRHLAIHIADLPTVQEDRVEEKKGPKTTAPEAALKGFAQGAGVDLAACETRTIGKDSYYFVTVTIKGRKVADAITEIASTVLRDFTWPKSMRWGARDTVWVRPLHRLVALFDDTVLPVSFGHITASNITQGHRFLAPAEITIAHADRYEEALEKGLVLVDSAKRKETIRAQIHAAVTTKKLSVVEDDDLLNEITGLIEFPTTYVGTFDESFLQLPREVLISEMKHHQRYVALAGANGEITNHFAVVSNMRHDDGGKVVIAGNERVLRARLSDGAFYYDTDKAKPLAEWAEGLRDVVFHAKVGMMHEKVTRIADYAVKIAAHFAGDDVKDATLIGAAANLCKADLTTGMVGEFPELQGIMGRYYAHHHGLDARVAEAIYDHYKPVGAGDSLPESALASVISVADKLDSIISLWAAGEKPTGSKDPLALRRAAIGILRILDAHGAALDLANLFPEQIAAELTEFFTDRMRQMLKDEGVRHDIIEAVLHASGKTLVPAALFAHVRKFSTWLKTPAGEQTAAAIKRALNIVQAEEKKSKAAIAIDTTKIGALKLPEEKKLWEMVQQAGNRQLSVLEELAPHINTFFDAVLVTEPEFRDGRLGLLASTREKALSYADFSRLEG